MVIMKFLRRSGKEDNVRAGTSRAPLKESAMNRFHRLLVSLASVLMITPTLAQSPAKLEVIVFAGGFN